MAKQKTTFFCKNCGMESPKWLGKCPGCGAAINVNANGKCAYCGTIYNLVDKDWVLSSLKTK